MILVVAPYASAELTGAPNLGASRKLEFVIEALAEVDEDIILVNSAHNACDRSSLRSGPIRIGAAIVRQIVPPTYRRRALGKLVNLAQVDGVLGHALGGVRPRLAWLYNGYAFEMRAARWLKRRAGCPVVLEFEDWHFARGRGLNPKPLVDWMCWRASLSTITTAYAVDPMLERKLRERRIPVKLLPGVVPAELAEMAISTPPFADRAKPVTVGYFGGLNAEKGVDVLLEAIARAPEGLRFILSGTGPLAPAVAALATASPDRLRYLGVVPVAELYENIRRCDALVNPHLALAADGSGVFPFKVIEAVASGRVLVSTGLAAAGLEDVLAGALYFDGSAEGLLAAFTALPGFFDTHREAVAAAAARANLRFGRGALVDDLRRLASPAG